jgi:hypothetical protein
VSSAPPVPEDALPLFRRMAVRTRREINKEKYALKALHGDFEDVPPDGRSDQDAR